MPRSAARLASPLDPALCYRALTTRDPRFDGRFFTAVRTTGIYCRPVCPAPTPKAENCTFFPSAAACEVAGFRSCLRCRPERAPSTAPRDRVIERAMALIAAGETPQALPRRLGLGGRQLRRLFAVHLGASPGEVARTRRNLLARQLVEETSLPITEVALAAGFESLRRFNHVFRSLYGQAPSAMRRGRVLPAACGAESGEMAGGEAAGGLTLSLPFRPPYDWPGLITLLAAHAIAGIERVEPAAYHRVISLGGHYGTLTITAGGADHLRARIVFPVLRLLPRIVARLRLLLDLGADPGPIAEVLGEDARLSVAIAARPGLRLPGAWDAFEAAVRIILAQQISLPAARQLSARLVSLYGTAVETPIPGLTHLFPEPARLLAAGESLSRDLNIPRARGQAILSLAEAVAAEPDLLARAATLDETIGRLSALRGIGPWTAHCIALMALGEPDAFPAQDIGLQRAAGLDQRGLATAAERWRPWRGYAAMHLWHRAIIEGPHRKETNHATAA